MRSWRKSKRDKTPDADVPENPDASRDVPEGEGSSSDVPPEKVWTKPSGVESVDQAEAPRAPTPEDCVDAFENAPVNEHGVPVDHRTGVPLTQHDAMGRRGWHVKWVPDGSHADGGYWVAENPGKGFGPKGIPEHGEPNTYGYDENGRRRKFANYRPRISMQTIMDVWKRDSFVGEDGKRYVEVDEPYQKVVTVEFVDGRPVEKTEWLTRKVAITWDGKSDRSKFVAYGPRVGERVSRHLREIHEWKT